MIMVVSPYKRGWQFRYQEKVLDYFHNMTKADQPGIIKMSKCGLSRDQLFVKL